MRNEVLEDDLLQVAVTLVELRQRFQRFDALVLGLADEFRSRGLLVFGPQRRAAELEGSKVFAKEFMGRHGVPTADFEIVHDAAPGSEADVIELMKQVD